MNEEHYFLIDVHVFDAVKMYKPSKHYAYLIWVTWSNNVKQLIFRRYSEFFNLQCNLIERFSVEAGNYNPTERILPFLPGKIIFRRSHVKSVAFDRLHYIDIYCKKLITLKSKISRSHFVLSFFTLTNNDIAQSSHIDSVKTVKLEEALAQNISDPVQNEEYICVQSYNGLSKNELSIRKGTKCFLVEKNLSGWWFIDSIEGQGFVPKCVILPLTPKLEKSDHLEKPILLKLPETYIVNKDYKKNDLDELTIKKGDFVTVLEKNFNGWWKIKNLDDSIGMAPAVYLKPINISFIDQQKPSIPRTGLSPTCKLKKICKEKYYAIESYQDLVGDGIDVFIGQELYVLSKDISTGWWFIRLNNLKEGWAPGSFLNILKPKRPNRKKTPNINNLLHLLSIK